MPHLAPELKAKVTGAIGRTILGAIGGVEDLGVNGAILSAQLDGAGGGRIGQGALWMLRTCSLVESAGNSENIPSPFPGLASAACARSGPR